MTTHQLDTLGVWLLLIAFSWTIVFQCGRIWERWSWYLAQWRAERLGLAAPNATARTVRYGTVIGLLLVVFFILPW